MAATATACAVAVLPDGAPKRIVIDPSASDLSRADSIHVLAFNSEDGLLLAESEGDFSIRDWDEVCSSARRVCCETAKTSGLDMVVDDEDLDGPDLRHFLRTSMEDKITSDLHWR
jgi:exosome complex component RRP46